MTGVLSQLSASRTTGTPDVTYPADDAFVFCSGKDCTGTCEVLNTDILPKDDAEYAPNNMGFLSIYWYDPGNYAWELYACINYEDCDAAAQIGRNTCYNLYDNGVSTDFYEFYYSVRRFGARTVLMSLQLAS